MAETFTTEAVNQVLAQADSLSQVDPDVLGSRYGNWVEDIRILYERSTPLTYLPVLCVTLVARALSNTVDVRRIQPGDEYSAPIVARALLSYGAEHHIDLRTDSSGLMNSKPFEKQAEITPNLTLTEGYSHFYGLVERVMGLGSKDAIGVLALVFHLGRLNWPTKYRRGQRNQQLPPTASTTTATVPSFILTRTASGQFSHIDGDQVYGFHENVTSARALVQAGRAQFVMYHTSNAESDRMCFVGTGQVTSVDPAGKDAEGRTIWSARVTGYRQFPRPVPKVEGAPARWNAQNSISVISADDFDRIVAMGTGSRREPLPLTVADLEASCSAKALQLPVGTLRALVAALASGKHVILTGPPGTAKTTLAVLVAELATENGLADGHLLTTATADWSTYDTIGGLAPAEGDQLLYRPGRFVQALESNFWLIVDEMNRSNFDRAFGQLFTVLAGADVTLPYDDAESGLPVRLRQESSASSSGYYDVVLRRDWRMVGTINNFDKSLLFEMSFALMRRFAFVEVPAPDDLTYRRLIRDAAEHPTPSVSAAAGAAVSALLPLRALKEMGPAIFIDAAQMARHLVGTEPTPSVGEVTFTVFYAMLLPQFEGLDEATGNRLQQMLRSACGPGHSADIQRVLREVLGLQLLGRRDTDDGDDGDDFVDDLPPDDGPQGPNQVGQEEASGPAESMS